MLAKIEPKVLSNHYDIDYDEKYDDVTMDDGDGDKKQSGNNQSIKEMEAARLN